MRERKRRRRRRRRREKKNQLKKPEPTVGHFHRGGKAICSGAESGVAAHHGECEMKRPLAWSVSAADLYRLSASWRRSAMVMGRGGGGARGRWTRDKRCRSVESDGPTDGCADIQAAVCFTPSCLSSPAACRRLLSHFKVLIVFRRASGRCSAESGGRWLKRWRSVQLWALLATCLDTRKIKSTLLFFVILVKSIAGEPGGTKF